MAGAQILVVDDDPKVRNLLRRCFEGEGFRVIEADDAPRAIELAQSAAPDLITLDIRLGKGDGFAVARAVRTFSDVAIIMVTGKDDVIDRIVGLELGADDYITKPFHLRELVARVRSVLRRSASQRDDQSTRHPVPTGNDQPTDPGGDIFSFDGLAAIQDRFELIDRGGQPCALTSGDFKLLNIFLLRPKRILSRAQLMDLIGGADWAPLDRTIDNQIARLRKKIEKDPANPKLITTVRGVGYAFSCDVERSGQPGPAKTTP
jgi:DNA-binding response OmpR family regulator